MFDRARIVSIPSAFTSLRIRRMKIKGQEDVSSLKPYSQEATASTTSASGFLAFDMKQGVLQLNRDIIKTKTGVPFLKQIWLKN